VPTELTLHPTPLSFSTWVSYRNLTQVTSIAIDVLRGRANIVRRTSIVGGRTFICHFLNELAQFEGIRINRLSFAPWQFGRRINQYTGNHTEWQLPVTAIRPKARYFSRLFVTSDRRPRRLRVRVICEGMSESHGGISCLRMKTEWTAKRRPTNDKMVAHSMACRLNLSWDSL